MENGIVYNELSDKDKEQYEELFVNEDGEIPETIDSSLLNERIFDKDTISTVHRILMEKGIKINFGSKIGALMGKMGGLYGIFSKICTAISGMSAPILAVVAVIAVLVVASFVHLWRTNDDFREKITAILEGVVEKVQAFVQTINGKFSALNIDFSTIKEKNTLSVIV